MIVKAEGNELFTHVAEALDRFDFLLRIKTKQ